MIGEVNSKLKMCYLMFTNASRTHVCKRDCVCVVQSP